MSDRRTASMLLVDAGNTRIKWRFVAADDPASDASTFGFASTRDAVAAGASALPFDDGPADVARVWVANVAGPDARRAIGDAVGRRWPGAAVDDLTASPFRCGVRNGYREPARLGADRWAALLGAWSSGEGRDALVCTFGTATTIDLLAASDAEAATATFVGGLILPGGDAMRRALARDTAGLPLADGRRADFAVATADAIESGIVEAQLGAVERAWRHATARLGRTPRLLFAGGGATTMRDAAGDRADHAVHDRGPSVEVVPDLVLRGLAAVARAAARDATVPFDRHRG